jgi:hypothetical protein
VIVPRAGWKRSTREASAKEASAKEASAKEASAKEASAKEALLTRHTSKEARGENQSEREGPKQALSELRRR